MSLKRCPLFYLFSTQGDLTPVRCKSWSCPDCARKNAREWAWRADIQIKASGGDYYFITFTMGGEYKIALEAFAELPRLWNSTRMWVSRNLQGQRWVYCAFLEGQPHRSDMPHFHIISNICIGLLATVANYEAERKQYGRRRKIRINDWAVTHGYGFKAEESVVNGKEAAKYVAKYATKQNPSTPRGFRRVRASRSWAKTPDYDVKLIPRQRTESTLDYCYRVSKLTGVPYSELIVQFEGCTNH